MVSIYICLFIIGNDAIGLAHLGGKMKSKYRLVVYKSCQIEVSPTKKPVNILASRVALGFTFVATPFPFPLPSPSLPALWQLPLCST